MATEDNTNNGSTGETSGQEPAGQQQAAPSETPSGEQQQAGTVTIDDSTQLPETHPLVKTLAANKTKLATQASEITELRATSKRVTELETELKERPTKEAVETLQTRYDRLEAFTQAVGLGKALDSRTFTKELFETDKDIATLVKEWNQANPTLTSTALGAKAAEPAGGKQDINAVLRAAAGK